MCLFEAVHLFNTLLDTFNVLYQNVDHMANSSKIGTK